MPKKTFKTAIESGHVAIIQIKENQPKLLANCRKITKVNKPVSEFSKRNKGRGRKESRTARIFNFEEFGEKTEWGNYIKSIVEINRIRRVFNTKEKKYKYSKEISFYASTTDEFTAKEFEDIIRNHWGIENRNHYVRDVSMCEDKSRIRVNPEIFIALRSFSLNIMRSNNVDNVANEQYRNSLNIDNILKYKYVINS